MNYLPVNDWMVHLSLFLFEYILVFTEFTAKKFQNAFPYDTIASLTSFQRNHMRYFRNEALFREEVSSFVYVVLTITFH